MITSRRGRWVVHVAHMGAFRNAHKILVWRCRFRQKDNIKMDRMCSNEIGWGAVARNGNTVMNIWFHKMEEIFIDIETVHFSIRTLLHLIL
jgi:hypothetical protein